MTNIPRILGTYTANKKGPLLFLSGGVHGNEPSGIKALMKVMDILKREKPQIKGTVVAVSGNQRAINNNVRYIDEDLNRTWTEENIKNHKTDSSEKKQMFEIIDVLEQYPLKDFTKRYFLDCHTTSSPTAPYISVQEVNDNDAWAHEFPPYIIRGFSDIVYGCIDHYLSRIGITGFVFEAGQHEDEDSEKNQEGIIWLALEKACGLSLETLQTYPEAVLRLLEHKTGQKTFEILYRHGLEKGDVFEMETGFKNFQPVKKGQLLAIQNGEEIKSEWDAFIFMPLYQKQGNDGFFIVEEVGQILI